MVHQGTRFTGARAAAESSGEFSGVDDRELRSVSGLVDRDPWSEAGVDGLDMLVGEMFLAGPASSWTAS